MKTEFIPFPPNARQFFLRGDFAFELCFADFAQSRGARHCFNVAYILDEKPTEWIFHYNDDLVKLYEPPRFFAYCLAVVRGSQKQVPLVGDGHLWMPSPKEGLFNDLLRRTNRIGQNGMLCNPVVAAVPKQPNDKWLFPAHVVLHDTMTRSAAVVRYDVAQGYLHGSASFGRSSGAMCRQPECASDHRSLGGSERSPGASERYSSLRCPKRF